jgi:hypothetical protein
MASYHYHACMFFGKKKREKGTKAGLEDIGTLRPYTTTVLCNY